MKKIFIVLFTLLSSVSVAQVTANMSQLSFFAGEWRGKMEWGDIEEYWSEPLGDNMMCTFRCMKNGKALFYEFVLIESKAGVPTMKLRHFNPGSIGWEDKDNPYEYVLIELTPTKCVFEATDKKTRLGYERVSTDQLLAVLEQEKNGKLDRTEFLYTKSK